MRTEAIEKLEALLKKEFTEPQLSFLHSWESQQLQRACVYYPTGKGKTLTALAGIALRKHKKCLVIAPPDTQFTWVELGMILNIEVEVMSHAKFRMPDVKIRRDIPVIVDEFHLLGGHSGKGWKKLDSYSRGLTAELMILSATPNYNDAERCYCVQHVLDPASVRGGFLQFLYTHCETIENRFGRVPLVTGFLRFKDAEEYLISLPQVFHVPDEVEYDIRDIPVQYTLPEEFDKYGFDERNVRMMASIMETKHREVDYALVNERGRIRDEIWDALTILIGQSQTPVIIFCAYERIAAAMAKTCQDWGTNYDIVTGSTHKKTKQQILERFRRGETNVLIGTSTMATGTDGLDQVCDTMIILNDTEDPALRRQLVGRILPRGLDTDATKKRFWRFTC